MLVDGTVVGSFTPSGTSYQSYTTAVFTVTAGAHTITFQGLDSAGGDNTAFIDWSSSSRSARRCRSATRDSSRCRWVRASSSTARPARPGPSPAKPASRPTTAASPRATRGPQGTQVAFLQGTGSFSQSVTNWAAGSYVISFYAAQRGNHQASQQDFEVLVNGTVVGDVHTLGHVVPELHHRRVHRHGRCAHDHVPGPGQRRRRQHRLHRRGRRPDGQCAVSVGDPGFEQVRWVRASSSTDPTGSPWTFSGQRRHQRQQQRLHRGQLRGPPGRAGRLPPGNRLVQPERHRLGRRLLRPSASTPRSAATTRRRSRTSRCWSTAPWWARFTPSGTSYQSYTTAVFTVTAGAHTITFQGLDSAGGDNTAFVDLVVVLS